MEKRADAALAMIILAIPIALALWLLHVWGVIPQERDKPPAHGKRHRAADTSALVGRLPY